MQALLFGLSAVVLSAAAAVAAEPLAKGIQDNSFLIEEAHSQEAGHVPHIFNFTFVAMRSGSALGPIWAQLSATGAGSAPRG